MKTRWILEASFKATEIEILKESDETAIVRIKGGENGFCIRRIGSLKQKKNA